MLRDQITLPGHGIEIHRDHFAGDTPDDVWLEVAGRNGWIVLSHDSKWHNEPVNLMAIKQWNVGAFYLWGGAAPKWHKLQLFARAFDRIVERANTTPKPFIYRIYQRGNMRQIALPYGVQMDLL